MAIRILGTARGYRESLGPFHTYLLTRGLVLDFGDKEVIVSDNAGSSLSIPTGYQSTEFGFYSPRTYAHLSRVVQRMLSAQLVGFSRNSNRIVAFSTDDHVISAGDLSELLLLRLNTLEDLVRTRVLHDSGISSSELHDGRIICANVEDDISYGRVSPIDLEHLITYFSNTGKPMKEAFFVFNATSIAEDMRHALLAACFHFGNLNQGIKEINENTPLSQFLPSRTDKPWEDRLYAEEVDELSYCYTSSVIACYTALDILYAYFVYLTREPFLNPEFPSNLHFPDAPGRSVFQGGGTAFSNDTPKEDLPYAIANLTPGEFLSLRKTRNALAHNMAPDSLRPRVYKGWKLLPVNDMPLQYVQYLSRDLDENGEPVAHPWSRRFYENQTDAQDGLLEWLEITWQCALDTTEWLIAHWSNHVNGC